MLASASLNSQASFSSALGGTLCLSPHTDYWLQNSLASQSSVRTGTQPCSLQSPSMGRGVLEPHPRRKMSCYPKVDHVFGNFQLAQPSGYHPSYTIYPLSQDPDSRYGLFLIITSDGLMSSNDHSDLNIPFSLQLTLFTLYQNCQATNCFPLALRLQRP